MTFVNKFPKSFPFDNSMLFELSNGDKEIRTPDPLLARQVLSQLSYTPMNPATTCSPIPSPA